MFAVIVFNGVPLNSHSFDQKMLESGCQFHELSVTLAFSWCEAPNEPRTKQEKRAREDLRDTIILIWSGQWTGEVVF
jgi:hypothetical protein